VIDNELGCPTAPTIIRSSTSSAPIGPDRCRAISDFPGGENTGPRMKLHSATCVLEYFGEVNVPGVLFYHFPPPLTSLSQILIPSVCPPPIDIQIVGTRLSDANHQFANTLIAAAEFRHRDCRSAHPAAPSNQPQTRASMWTRHQRHWQAGFTQREVAREISWFP